MLRSSETRGAADFVSRALQVGATCKQYRRGKGRGAGAPGDALPLRCCPRVGRMQRMQGHKGSEGEREGKGRLQQPPEPPLRLSITSAPLKEEVGGGWPQCLPVPMLSGITMGCSRAAGRTWPWCRVTGSR